MKIEVRDSPLHGLGVFALRDIRKGEVIERCSYLVIDDDDLQEINRLNDYLFTSPDVKTDYLVMLGCGMLYNHGAPANAEWQIADDDNRFVEFTALIDIRAGDEILHDYGSEYWDSRTDS
jgi:SET domain-containing protein